MYSFSYFEPVCCSMFSSKCSFLTYIQVSQEAGQGVWYSNLFQNFPQFIVIHRVKGFGIINKAEIDVFLVLSYFPDDPVDVQSIGSQDSDTAEWISLIYIYIHTLVCVHLFIPIFIISELSPKITQRTWQNNKQLYVIEMSTPVEMDTLLERCVMRINEW